MKKSLMSILVISVSFVVLYFLKIAKLDWFSLIVFFICPLIVNILYDYYKEMKSQEKSTQQ